MKKPKPKPKKTTWCVWTKGWGFKGNGYLSGCGRIEMCQSDWNFCPICGKKIKVKG